MISSASVVSALPASDVVSCDLEGVVALLHLHRGAYYGLDEVGTRVWQLLEQPQRVASVREILVGEFEVDAQQCERDLLIFLQQMAEAGLIGVHNEA